MKRSHLALALLVLLSATLAIAQEENPAPPAQEPTEESSEPEETPEAEKEEPPPPESTEPIPAEGEESGTETQEPETEEPETQEPETQEPETQEPETEEPETGESEPTESEDPESAEEPQEPVLTPEEQAKIEEARLKREERQAKREARQAKEEAKQAAKKTKEEIERDAQLWKILDNGYLALENGEFKRALQAFQNHVDETRGRSYEGRIGLAHTRLAMGEPAAAVDNATKALKFTQADFEKAEALILAANATLSARPVDEVTLQPLPGTEFYADTALRFFAQAVVADPDGASEARRHLEARFPTPADERTQRLYGHYLEMAPRGPQAYARRLAATYEALMSGTTSQPLVVAGGVAAPVKTSGSRPPYPQPPSKNIRKRLVAGLVIEADGSVSDVQILNGLDRKRDRAASETLMAWSFEPARLPSGAAVPVYYVVAVNAIVE